MTRVPSRVRLVACLAGAMLLLAPPGAGSSQKTDRTFNVGVMRADGVLIPFAQFNRGEWLPFWTGANDSSNIVVPLSLEDVDRKWWRRGAPSLDWTLWRAGQPPLAVKASAPRVVSTPCGTEVGLATDLKPQGMLPPPFQSPYPKLGVATTAPVEFEAIAEIEPGDTDWTRVQRALDDGLFRNAENMLLGNMEWSHPVGPTARARQAIELQKVWHVKDSRFFYFEAMRRYADTKPPKGKPPCELVTYVAGYLWEERSENLKPAGVSALISYCHMERASFLWPFGVIREGGRQYWLFQSAGWTGELYGISEPEPRRGFVRRHLWHVAGRCQ